jgi:(E)-4-hydroxy-3-methylbut-2-enyl-diphosphate synthase
MINRFGDTAEGMVESALEFIRIFQELDFHKLVVSLKASNVVIMVQANQLMAKRMKEKNLGYPLHLGVTEAGDAEDGRIKSATGIGLLLSQGIGETIRVSLTEEPEFEIPVAQKIVEVASQNQLNPNIEIFNFERKNRNQILNIGGSQAPVVIDSHENGKADYQADHSRWTSAESAIISRLNSFTQKTLNEDAFYYEMDLDHHLDLSFLETSSLENVILVIRKTSKTSLNSIHELIDQLYLKGIFNPIVLKIESIEEDHEKWMVEAAVVSSSFLLSGKVDGLWLDHPVFPSSEIALGILQATRKRISKTEYIACPSCGRTLFNIQEKLQEVKAKTAAFKGLKIAVMGCIVNGLGEMADADYGYVGAGKGKVNLYKGHELIRKNVDENHAADMLLEIINNHL